MAKDHKRRLDAARSQFDRARLAIGEQGPTDEAESELRSSMVALRAAMDWLEGSDAFEEAHRLLDEAGALARTTTPNGCHLSYEEPTYFLRCPVALAHNRVAMSPTYFVHEANCSICEADIERCSHIPGMSYDGIVCHRIIKNFEILDVFFVGNPAQPDARIQQISVETSRLAESLGAEFHPGVPVLCDRCLSPCDGVVRNFDEE